MQLSLHQCVAQHLMVGIRGLRRALAEVAEPPPQTHTTPHSSRHHNRWCVRAAIRILRRKAVEKVHALALWRHLGTSKFHLHSFFWILLRVNRYCYDKEYAKSQRTLAILNGKDDWKTLYHFLSALEVSYWHTMSALSCRDTFLSLR